MKAPPKAPTFGRTRVTAPPTPQNVREALQVMPTARATDQQLVNEARNDQLLLVQIATDLAWAPPAGSVEAKRHQVSMVRTVQGVGAIAAMFADRAQRSQSGLVRPKKLSLDDLRGYVLKHPPEGTKREAWIADAVAWFAENGPSVKERTVSTRLGELGIHWPK